MVKRYEVKVAFTQEYSVDVYAESEEEAAAYFETRGGIETSEELLANEGRYQIGEVTLDDETVAVGEIEAHEEAYPEVTEARVLITWERVVGDDPDGGEYTDEDVMLCTMVCREVQRHLTKMFPLAADGRGIAVFTDRAEYAQAHTMVYFEDDASSSRKEAALIALDDLVEEVIDRRVATYEQDKAWVREHGEAAANAKLEHALEELWF